MQKEQSIQDILSDTDQKTYNRKKLYVAMVLDQSGSMMRGARETVDGFNEQIQSVREGLEDQLDVEVIFTTFGSSAAIQKDFVNINEMADLTDDDYCPAGLTAMYDGVGITINALKERSDINSDDTKVLMVILSDGAENNSKQFTQSDVAEMIQDVKDTGRWTITYMGANQDLSEITAGLNIDAGNTVVFDASDAVGYAKGAAMRSAATTMYMSGVAGAAGDAGPMGDVGATQSFYADVTGD
ncbi:MAG: hypothetical protein JXR12_05825 [Neptunomonas phycophila]|uniref:hypothetical protein n=1 Tax=Neptunomonas phycophila TaxID=1572645 RepID=UPI003B8E9B5E